MKLSPLLRSLVLFVEFALALKCSEHSILSRYNVDKHVVDVSYQRKTPPSTTEEVWFIDLCKSTEPPSRWCAKGDIMCYKKVINPPGSSAVVSEMIEIQDTQKFTVSEEGSGLSLRFSNIHWGDELLSVTVNYECEETETDVRVSSSRSTDSMELNLRGPSGCISHSTNSPPKSTGSRIASFITWIFIYTVLFTLIILLVASYMNTRNQGMQDFREDFVERSTSLVVSLPDFAKEVFGKVVGSGSASRGGYSAV